MLQKVLWTGKFSKTNFPFSPSIGYYYTRTIIVIYLQFEIYKGMNGKLAQVMTQCHDIPSLIRGRSGTGTEAYARTEFG